MTSNKLVEFRKELHKYPELSGDEIQTSRKIREFLEEFRPSEIIPLGETAMAVVFDSGKPGKTVLLRADMDALPIEEETDLPYQSMNIGVGHKCGHDGHSTILCGVGIRLAEQPLQQGKAILLFQPSEETGEGAYDVLHHPKFKTLKPDWVFALHNLPGFPAGQVVCKHKTFTAAVRSLIIKLKGRTSHAAEPENGINPALAVAEILKSSDQQNLNQPEDWLFQLVTPVYTIMGEKAYGTSAGYAEVHLTLRTWTNKQMDVLVERIQSLCAEIAERHQLKLEYDWTDTFYATMNHPEAVESIKSMAEKLGFSFSLLDTPFKWGEDFGLFTESFPGAMFGLGAGENAFPLHHPDYDWPDEITETGIDMFYGLLRKLC